MNKLYTKILYFILMYDYYLVNIILFLILPTVTWFNRKYLSPLWIMCIIFLSATISTLIIFCLSKLYIKHKVKNIKPGKLYIFNYKNLYKTSYMYPINKHFNYNSKINVYDNEHVLVLEKPILGKDYDIREHNMFDEHNSKVKVLYKDKICWADPRFLEEIN